MGDVCEDLEDCNSTKKKLVIVSDDMIADNKKGNKKIKSYRHWIVFKRNKTQHFSCFYITILFQSLKDLRLNMTHHFMKMPKRELQQIASDHSSDIKFKDFMKLYKDYTKEPFHF